ncbi:phage major capsid protein [Massilia violaceinigra]|uniref:Phage major capsid protein n=1 Tax=Massilia violaceinigra TaxID=2045208 RepID=A0A2D2DTK1_9BURK|nr:phage major capsid protein [Massilia violaceinigra]ATQ78286.1 phage major capsid protein [Massilia violaceinigra]
MATEIEVKQELAKISDQVKEQGEKAMFEAKKAGDMSTETKGRVDELLVKQGELQAQLLEIQQKMARRGGTDDEGRVKTAGELVIGSTGLKEQMDGGWSKNSKITVSMKAITSLNASAGTGVVADRAPGVQLGPQRRMTVRDLISPGTTASNLYQYLQESGFTNAAATTAEGVRKPESSINFVLKNAQVVKIPHFIKASSEILSDFPALQSVIDEKLRYGLMLAEEAQLLKGSGVGNNLNGIYTQATGYVPPIVIASPTRIDVLRLALLQAELAEYPSTGICLHPTDWAAIELLKDTTGAYIFANPQSLAQPGLWGRPVVATQAMTVDQFLVGAFRMGAQVFDRQQAAVTIATENEDDFVNNLLTILAEERLALAVYRPEAFVKGDITPA